MKSSSTLFNKGFYVYVIKLGLIFCFFYFGTLAIIGVSAPEGIYIPFIAKFLNYIDWLRASLLFGAKEVLILLDYQPYLKDKYELYASGYGIRMVYSCIGYGVMSFWAAFVLANKGSLIKKIKWLLVGWISIWVINVLRIALLVISLNKDWQMPLGWDHHTWFNIFAYLLIFILIYFYDKSMSYINKKPDYPKYS